MGNQTLATYIFSNPKRPGRKIRVDVVGCWSKDTPKDTDFDFYDLYIGRRCINEGDPCHDWPTWLSVRCYLETLESRE